MLTWLSAESLAPGSAWPRLRVAHEEISATLQNNSKIRRIEKVLINGQTVGSKRCFPASVASRGLGNQGCRSILYIRYFLLGSGRNVLDRQFAAAFTDLIVCGGIFSPC